MLGGRQFLFWQGFWHVWSCSDLLKVFCMVGLFTSPPTNWRLFRVKFQQVNWPWNSKSCVICAPLGWVLVGTIGQRVSQVLVDSWSPYRLTVVGWHVERSVGRHSSNMSAGVSTNMSTKTLAHTPVSIPVGTRTIQAWGVSIFGGISVDYWWCIGWLSYTMNSLLKWLCQLESMRS